MTARPHPLRTLRYLKHTSIRAAAGIVAGEGTMLKVGNLAMEKEWVFAGDIVRAMWTLVKQEAVFEVVIGSGEVAPLSAWIEACFTAAGLDWREWTREKPGYRADFQRLVSNPARIRQLGWQPEVTLAGLAAMMVRTPVTAES